MKLRFGKGASAVKPFDAEPGFAPLLFWSFGIKDLALVFGQVFEE
jgi:hypothetical protein